MKTTNQNDFKTNKWTLIGAITMTLIISGCDVQDMFHFETSIDQTETTIDTGTKTKPQDTTPPNITLLGANPLSVVEGGVFEDPGAVAVDDRDGNVSVTVSGKVDTAKVGSYVRTYAASDTRGNQAVAERIITVISRAITVPATPKVSKPIKSKHTPVPNTKPKVTQHKTTPKKDKPTPHAVTKPKKVEEEVTPATPKPAEPKVSEEEPKTTPETSTEPTTQKGERTYTKLSDHLFISDRDNVAILIVPDLNKSEKLIYNHKKIQEITNTLYQHFDDVYDFIFLVTNNKKRPKTVSYAGVFSKAKNDVEGIGASLYDNTAQYGSAGHLKGVMHFAYRQAILRGPTLHEISHYWANKFHFDLQEAPHYRLGSGSHWGETSFFGGKGQLGGSDANTLKSHDYTYEGKSDTWKLYSAKMYGWNANGGNSLPYNDVELYLMGMLEKDQVKDIVIPTPYGLSLVPKVKEDPTFINDIYQRGRRYFLAQEMVRKSWSEVLSDHNIPDRKPDASQSQKHFRVLTVLLDTQMPESFTVDILSAQVRSLAYKGNDGKPRNYNFYEATRGAGTLQADNLAQSVRGESQPYPLEETFASKSLSFRGKEYTTVRSPYTGRVWLDRNLGADKVCDGFADTGCYGDLFEFGRGYDGHQKRNSPATHERKTALQGNDNRFVIAGNSRPLDWMVAGVDDDLQIRIAFLRNSVGEGICPSGFRVPTVDEFSAETRDNEMGDPFPSEHIEGHFLRMPLAGYRNSQSTSGLIMETGSRGSYWTSTPMAISDNGIAVRHIYYNAESFVSYPTLYLFNAHSIRCVEEE